MKAGKKPNPNKGMGGNMQKQMAQMQAMQRKMEELQEEIDKKGAYLHFEIEVAPWISWGTDFEI